MEASSNDLNARKTKTTTTRTRKTASRRRMIQDIVDLTDDEPNSDVVRPPDPIVASRLMGTPPRPQTPEDGLEDALAHSLRQFHMDQDRRKRQTKLIRATWTDNEAVLREATRRLSWALRFPRDGDELEATETFQRILTRFEEIHTDGTEAWSYEEAQQVARQMVRIHDHLPTGFSTVYVIVLRLLDALIQTYLA